MTIQNYIKNTINYFISKHYLENNIAAAYTFEEIKSKFYALTNVVSEGKLAPSKKNFNDFILTLRENIKSLENSADRRLMRGLIALTLMIRRESNKQKNYLSVLNLNVSEISSDLELSKAAIFSDKKIVTLKYPRK